MFPGPRLRLAACTALVVPAAWPAAASACACCASPGTWLQETARIAPFERAELRRLRFRPVATTYVTEAGPSVIRGINPVAARYALSVTRLASGWTLRFRDAKGNRGTLTLRLPAQASKLAVDPKDRRSPGGGPLLYRAWRLESPIVGTGVFARGLTGGARYRLLLQGRGNACMNAQDFKHWVLQVSGPSASFALHGAFAPPTAA